MKFLTVNRYPFLVFNWLLAEMSYLTKKSLIRFLSVSWLSWTHSLCKLVNLYMNSLVKVTLQLLFKPYLAALLELIRNWKIFSDISHVSLCGKFMPCNLCFFKSQKMGPRESLCKFVLWAHTMFLQQNHKAISNIEKWLANWIKDR